MITSKGYWSGVLDNAETMAKRSLVQEISTDALFDLLESRLDTVEAELRKLAHLRAGNSSLEFLGVSRRAEYAYDKHASAMHALQNSRDILEAQWAYLQQDEHESYYIEADGETLFNIYVMKPVSITTFKEKLTEDGFGIVSEVVDGEDFVNILVDTPTDKVLSIADGNFAKLIDSVEAKNREYRACKCKSCGKIFPILRREDYWMRNKGLANRVRCSDCVEKRKQMKEVGNGVSNTN